MATKPIRIHWNNRQRRHRLNLAYFRRKVTSALHHLEDSRRKRLPLELGIVFVSPQESGRLHQAHLQDPSPADVLAFPHGEVVVCPAVAASLCRGHGLTLREELLTYILHGILHLAGFRDSTPEEGTKMRRMQTRLRKMTNSRS